MSSGVLPTKFVLKSPSRNLRLRMIWRWNGMVVLTPPMWYSRRGAVQDAQGLLPALARGHQQTGGAVVLRGELVARRDARVQPDAGAAGGDVAGDAPGVGREAVLRILAVHAHLHGEVLRAGGGLVEAQLGPEGDGDLLLDEVHAVAHLGDAVLHLQAGIDLDEVRGALVVHQEFHGGQRVVAPPQGRADARIPSGARATRGSCPATARG